MQQRVPESEWVDEGLNGLEGKLEMCVYTGITVRVYVGVCACVFHVNLEWKHVPNHLGNAKRKSTASLII